MTEPSTGGPLVCANHPNTPTVLRCNRCGKPICTRCAVQTPVGYRCRMCVGRQQAVFYSGGGADYVIGGAIALVLGAGATFLMRLVGSWFIALILGPTAGIGVAEAVRLATRRRRSRYLWLAAVAGLAVGAAVAVAFSLSGSSLFRLLAPLLFAGLAASGAAARLR